MGGTIPLLTQALPASVHSATRLHALLYAANTLGAFVGALSAAFFLIPRLGLDGVMAATSAINLIAGVVLVGLSRLRISATAAAPDPHEVGSPRTPVSHLAVACLVGFAMMTVQTIAIRVGGLSLGASPFTFSSVVASFVLGIGLGSLAVSILPRVPKGALSATLGALALWLAVLYGALEMAPYGAHVLRTLFRDELAPFGLYWALVVVAGLVALGPSAALSGATLPLLFDQLRGRFGLLGQAAGSLYSINTLGSLAGALLGGYALLFWLDLHHVYRIALIAVIAAALISAFIELSRTARVAAALLSAAMTFVVLALPAWRPELLAAGLFRVRGPTPHSYDGVEAMVNSMEATTLLFHDDDPIATVTVPRRDVDGKRTLSLVTNGKSDGNTHDDYATMSLAALIPAVLTEPLESAFVIGLGTGITAGELAALDGMQRVTVAEISPAVVAAAGLFDFASLGASRHPRVEIIRSDAYRALSRMDRRFDVIVSEPSNPWVAGVEMLFTREFYRTSRSRLSSHGLFVQWIHEYESDEATLDLVLRTFDAEFPRSAIWYGNGPDLILVGLGEETPEPDFRSVARRTQRGDIRAGLQRAGISNLPQLLAHELVPTGVLHALELRGPLHRLYHPRLNDLATRAFFAGRSAVLPFSGRGDTARLGAENSLFAQYERRRSARAGGLTEREWAAFADEVCHHRTRECIAALARWTAAYPESPGPARIVERRLRDGSEFPAQDLRAVAGLFRSGGPRPTATTPGQLVRSSELVHDYYFHTVPFDPALLGILSRTCEAPPATPEACDVAREQSAALLRAPRTSARHGR